MKTTKNRPKHEKPNGENANTYYVYIIFRRRTWYLVVGFGSILSAAFRIIVLHGLLFQRHSTTAIRAKQSEKQNL